MASFKELVQSDRPVLIDFHATWCGPCKTLSPIVQQVAQELGSKVRVLKIDVDKNQVLANNLGIRGVPTLMIYQNGALKWRQSGVVPAQEILNRLNPLLPN